MAKEFAQPLILTTPLIKGSKVKDAQYLMAGHSRFKGLATLKDANIDGAYGKITADATKRTKYWLGYPINSCDRVFGQTLYEYLRPNKWRVLPKEYQDRRAQRLAAATKTPGMKALELAATQIGTHESPYGSNLQKYGQWYGYNGVFWCDEFISWCFYFSGWKTFHYASVELTYLDAHAGRNHLREVWSPMAGDLCCFNLHGDPYAHISFFEKWENQSQGSFYDIGGNTGPANISNGGAVMRQTRYKSMVSHFIRVG